LNRLLTKIMSDGDERGSGWKAPKIRPCIDGGFVLYRFLAVRASAPLHRKARGKEFSLSEPLALRCKGADASTARNLYRTNPLPMQGRIFGAFHPDPRSPSSLIIFVKRRFNCDVLLVVYDEQPDVQGFL